MPIAHVADDKRHLTNTKGQPFFIVGVNYLGYFDRLWQLWEPDKFDPELIKRDFQKMADTGLNLVRLFSSAAMEAYLKQGDFNKLDRVIQFAADHRMLVLLTLNGSRNFNLEAVAEMDHKIVGRYCEDPVILGWDLEDRPGFFHLAGAIYPQARPASVQTDALIQTYGRRMSQQETVERQQAGYIPAHLGVRQAYYYANAQILFDEFKQDARRWSQNSEKTVIDYIYSRASERWHFLIDVLNETLAVWLSIRGQAINQVDPNHLITMTYHDLNLAGLPANRDLDFMSYSHYGTPSFSNLQRTYQNLASFQRAFPTHPLLMTEFGYANQTSPNPALSQIVKGETSAVFELALIAHLRAKAYAGGLKWNLNDGSNPDDPYGSSFGLYRQQDNPKPIQTMLGHLKSIWDLPSKPLPDLSPTRLSDEDRIQIIQDHEAVAFRLDIPGSDSHQILLGGKSFQDKSLSWRSETGGYCYLLIRDQTIIVSAQSSGFISLAPWDFIPTWPLDRSSVIYRPLQKEQTPLMTVEANQIITWTLQPHLQYDVKPAESVQAAPDIDLQRGSGLDPGVLIPNPGEHVVLLGDSDTSLRLAIPYIRAFAPEITFAPDDVAGRWIYVTVIDAGGHIPAACLETIKAAGAHLVERLEDDIATTIKWLLSQKRRFLGEDLILPPGDDRFSEPLQPSNFEEKTVIVQPEDTLRTIAQRVYGQPQQAALIFHTNRDILTTPQDLRPGLILKIPLLPPS